MQVRLSSSLSIIEKETFANCKALSSITLPDSVEYIGEFAFYDCSLLKTFAVPESCRAIGNNAFYTCKLTVKCYENSYAHDYAQRNNIPFEFIKSAGTSFTDVPRTSWYNEAVKYCTSRCYLKGIGNGKFSPEGLLTREQLVVILARIENVYLNDYNISYFTDLKTDSWYGPSVIWANENGYVEGVGARKFGVGQKMSREQLKPCSSDMHGRTL